MSSYEYTVIPAPARGEKAKGARTGVERFAATLADTLNEMAREGWDYVRAEVLPAEERSGLTSRNTVYHNLLVFRRALDTAPARTLPLHEPAPQPAVAPEPPAPQASRATPEAAPREKVAPDARAPEAAIPDARVPEPRAPETAAAETAAPVRAPFSQPMRAMPKPQSRAAEPPLTAPPQPAPPAGPRLGPAMR